MQNKLQELTDKLFNEGLSKGKEEAELMITKAKKEASEIITKAKEEALAIVNNAKKESAELESKVKNDITMASNQSIAALKQQIETSLINLTISKQVKSVMSDTEFIKEIIKTVVLAFNSNKAGSTPLNLILPESQQVQLDSFLKDELTKELGTTIDLKFVKQQSLGFKIGPKDEGYLLSFTEEDFQKLIAQYLRPKTKTLLFGK